MTFHVALRITQGLLVAGIALGAVAAQAAGGFTITQGEETRIAVGMSETEVQQNLGRPARINQYRGKPGPTWTYVVVGAPFGMTDFDVDFGSDGKVASTGEMVFGSSH